MRKYLQLAFGGGSGKNLMGRLLIVPRTWLARSPSASQPWNQVSHRTNAKPPQKPKISHLIYTALTLDTYSSHSFDKFR